MALRPTELHGNDVKAPVVEGRCNTGNSVSLLFGRSEFLDQSADVLIG